MLKKTSEYEVAEVLVCREYLKSTSRRCNVNFEYTIDAVSGSTVTISEGGNTLELNKELIRKHFIHSYCRTCHSFQGSSISDKITIFDWKFFFVNRK